MKGVSLFIRAMLAGPDDIGTWNRLLYPNQDKKRRRTFG